MAGPTQTLIFTAMPRGISIDPAALPVSVLVSPRLAGAPHLDAFGDWLTWTRHLKTRGLRLTFTAGGQNQTVAIDTKPLQPDLWEAIFDRTTRVDDYVFDDFTGRTVLSYPNRLTLTLLKSIYQIAGLQLALPDQRGRDEPGKRAVLRQLLDGLAVHWNERRGREARAKARHTQRDQVIRLLRGDWPVPNPFRFEPAAANAFTAPEFGGDGLPNATQLPRPGQFPEPGPDGSFGPPPAQTIRQDLAEAFAVYHHIPPAPPLAPPDFDKVLDFHKAISALQSYPALLRALGLVFDVELPASFLPLTPAKYYDTLAVTGVTPGWPWGIAPAPVSPPITAYQYVAYPQGPTVFLTAPRALPPPNSPKPPPDPSGEIIGLLNLDPRDYGLVQVDIDGAMNKAIIVAESIANTAPPLHPEVFDPTSTLPSLRSAGLALVSDASALALLKSFHDAKKFNDLLAGTQPWPAPLFADDLVRGFCLDVRDSTTKSWHSLHRRDAVYTIKQQKFTSRDEEGFTQLSVTSGAPGSDPAQSGDFRLQDAIARWDGWSLSVPPPGKHLTRDPDPLNAVPPNPGDSHYDPENPPVTPFKMTTEFAVVKGSLPSLRFGRTYRVRARAVDLAGNSLKWNDPIADGLAALFATPRDADGFAYLRYEPVVAPAIIPRDAAGLTSPGSAADRLVIRTYNDDPSKDDIAADLTGSERHIVPPRIAVELAERLGMFDDANGKLRGDAATYALIKQRDEGKFKAQNVFNDPPVPPKKPPPVEPDAQIACPYLPDRLARGAALRDLPGAGSHTLGSADPATSANPIAYPPLADANPRPGSVTLVDFDGAADWTKTRPFRLVLADGDAAPAWDAAARTLAVSLPKASTSIVPLSCYVAPGDLRLMGVWQWMREYFDALARTTPISEDIGHGSAADAIAHVVQRATEGGHWMLTPPHLLTLIHAVQQPIGRPEFVQLDVQHHPDPEVVGDSDLQSEDMSGPTAEVALATLSGWRTPNSLDAYLVGGLRVHGASTAKIDILAEWDDPVDDGTTPPGRSAQSTHADEIPLHGLQAGYLKVSTGASASDWRAVGYYDPVHDLIGFVRKSDRLSATLNGVTIYQDAAPRHHFNDTKHHRVTYTAVATSRYRDYFVPLPSTDPNSAGQFVRKSDTVEVDIPASARPDAPRVFYVVPTFGWERQTGTNLKRSTRFGGGLRVYLDRPWYSSGDGELLGVVLYGEDFPIDREAWKTHVTQWGNDPIWATQRLWYAPNTRNFPLSVANEEHLSLQEPTPPGAGGKGRVAVTGHEVHFDGTRWYSDITIEHFSDTYAPFVRLALARYQPHALDDAKLSKVVLADFAQLTPDRALLVTADPYHPRSLRVTVSGPVPLGPAPSYPDFPPMRHTPARPTQVVVTVQQRDPAITGDLGWKDAAASVVGVTADTDGQFKDKKYVALWSGIVQFAQPPQQGQFRLLIREYEYISANWAIVHPGGEALPPWSEAPGRLIYAETIEIDATLTGAA
jgi:hypothetical protein